jgi:hypothetical protein
MHSIRTRYSLLDVDVRFDSAIASPEDALLTRMVVVEGEYAGDAEYAEANDEKIGRSDE